MAEPNRQAVTLSADPGLANSPIRILLHPEQKLEFVEYRGERLWRIVSPNTHLDRTWFFDVDDSLWWGRLGSAVLEIEFVASATNIDGLIHDSEVYRSLGLDRARDFPYSFPEEYLPARSVTTLRTVESQKQVRFSLPRAFFGNRAGLEKADFNLQRWNHGWIGIRRLVLHIEPLSETSGLRKNSMEIFIRKAFRRILSRDPLPEEREEALASLRSGDLDLLYFLYNLVRSEEYHRTWYRPFDRTASTEILFRKLLGRRITDEELAQIFESDEVDTIDSVAWDILWRLHSDVLVHVFSSEEPTK